MAYVFDVPVTTIHGKNSFSESVKFPNVSATGAEMTLAQTAAQVNKLLAIIGATFVEDTRAYRQSKEGVVSDGD